METAALQKRSGEMSQRPATTFVAHSIGNASCRRQPRTVVRFGGKEGPTLARVFILALPAHAEFGHAGRVASRLREDVASRAFPSRLQAAAVIALADDDCTVNQSDSTGQIPVVLRKTGSLPI